MKHYTVKSTAEAWRKAAKVLPFEVQLDARSTERVGYPIHRSAAEYYDYICDLGCRLEVNLSNGETVNIWIKEEEATEQEAAQEVSAASAAEIMNAWQYGKFAASKATAAGKMAIHVMGGSLADTDEEAATFEALCGSNAQEIAKDLMAAAIGSSAIVGRIPKNAFIDFDSVKAETIWREGNEGRITVTAYYTYTE